MGRASGIACLGEPLRLLRRLPYSRPARRLCGVTLGGRLAAPGRAAEQEDFAKVPRIAEGANDYASRAHQHGKRFEPPIPADQRRPQENDPQAREQFPPEVDGRTRAASAVPHRSDGLGASSVPHDRGPQQD